jgi:excinuclease ABC subunit B
VGAITEDIDLDERIELLDNFKIGVLDVLVGVNLLREGLDLPMVSLVMILSADREGFLRTERALIQIAGRAARNVDGLVVIYCNKISNSIENFLIETERRRNIQLKWNEENGIVPTNIKEKIIIKKEKDIVDEIDNEVNEKLKKLKSKDIEKIIKELEKNKKNAEKNEDFEAVLQWQIDINKLKKLL